MEMETGRRLVLGVLLVQVIATGMQILSKVILGQGTFVFALMTYRQIVATFCIAPFAFFREREGLKKLDLSVLTRLFFVALSGISIAMGLFYYGLRDTTATYASNFLNLIPIVTFALSIILREEKLQLNSKNGKMKLIGAMLCLAGALTIALYKGKMFHISDAKAETEAVGMHVKLNWKRGTTFLVCSCLSYGFWLITQAKVLKKFPYVYSATTIICIMGALQCMVVGLCIDRTKASWALGWNLQLITIFYSGALVSAASFCLMCWATAKRGPTYASMFNPVSLILVAIIEAIFFGASISVGSLIGMALIIMGLYLFLWGKNMEIKSFVQSRRIMGSIDTESIADETAMLQLTAVVMPFSSPSGHYINMQTAVSQSMAAVVPISSPSYRSVDIEVSKKSVEVIKSFKKPGEVIKSFK